MRTKSLNVIVFGAVAALTMIGIPRAAAAQRGRGPGAGGCVSPLPMPGLGARGGRGGPPPDGALRPDSAGRGRGGRGLRAGGCPPFFPDSLKLSSSQSQQITALRAQFRQANAAPFAQLRTIADSAAAARKAGATRDQLRAIMDQAKPINESLRSGEQQVQKQVEALLTPGQLAWMNAFRPPPRRRP